MIRNSRNHRNAGRGFVDIRKVRHTVGDTMDAGQIRELVHAAPFRPFSIVLPSDRVLRVPHPDFISIAPNRRTLIVWKGNGGGQIIDVEAIVELRTGRVGVR